MQNKCFHMCTNSKPRTPVDGLHQDAGLPKLATQREAHTCNLVFEGLKDILSKGINQMFEYSEPRARNNTLAIENMQLSIPINRIKICDCNIKVRGAKYYNELPLDIKMKPSYESHKEAVKLEKGIETK